MNKVDEIKKSYPKGTRIELIAMDDPQAPAAGTKGTVVGVDDMGDILMAWDNGSSLNLIPGIDKFKIVE